jgi:ABC-type bacteriocin/lantibiotic exporter with double-glycine peptidase domain
MTAHRVRNDNRVLRFVMPLDTALSGVFVVLALAAVPALVVVNASTGVLWVVGLVVIVVALALAAMGAVTAWTLLRSMARGRYDLPSRLWLPLPRAAQPFPGGRTDTDADLLPASAPGRGDDTVDADR